MPPALADEPTGAQQTFCAGALIAVLASSPLVDVVEDAASVPASVVAVDFTKTAVLRRGFFHEPRRR